MMSAERPPRLVEPAVGPDEDLEEGARLGAPPPEWDDDDSAETETAGRGASGREGAHRTLIMRGALVAMVVLGFVPLLWFALQMGTGDPAPEELPVIAAESGEFKVKPADPGGKEVLHQDTLVLNPEAENGGSQAEKLLPPPEVPLPVEQPVAEEEIVDPIPTVEPPAEPELTASDPVAVPDVVPDAPAPAEPPGEEAAAASSDEMTKLVDKIVNSDNKSEASEAAEPANVPEPAIVPEPAETQVAEAGGNFALQIAALKSDEAARGEWTRLQKAYPDLLNGLSPVVQEAKIENVGQVYRLQIGTFPTRSTAADLCAELKARKLQCFIVQR